MKINLEVFTKKMSENFNPKIGETLLTVKYVNVVGLIKNNVMLVKTIKKKGNR